MALNVNDIIRVTTRGTFQGQTCLNVYYFLAADLPSPAEYSTLAVTMGQDLELIVCPQLHTGFAFDLIKIENVTNGLDILETAVTISGDRTGDPMPSFVALGFQLIRTTRLTRHGAKRFAGVPEACFVGNTITVGDCTTGVQAIADWLALGLYRDDIGDLNHAMLPIIPVRYPVGHEQEGEINTGAWNLVQDAQFRGITTQNTRKPGRGI